MLKEESTFTSDCYLYQQPVKVADGIKMVWTIRPGNQPIEYGELRTYFLTEQNELFVCGEKVGDERRQFTYLGELGPIEEETLYENCTSKLHKVIVSESNSVNLE